MASNSEVPEGGGPDSIPQRRLSDANASRPRTTASASRRLSSDASTQLSQNIALTTDASLNVRPESSTVRAKAGSNSLRSSSEDSTASITVTPASLPPPKKSSPTKNIVSPDLKGPSAGSRRSGASSASAISSLSSAAVTKASSSNTSRTGISTPTRHSSPSARSITDKRSPAGASASRIFSMAAGSITSTRSPPTARSSPSMIKPKSKIRSSPASSSASVTSRVLPGRPSVRQAMTEKTASQSALAAKVAIKDSKSGPDQMILPASMRLVELEKDNESLREKLQSFHTEESTNPEKLNLWRLRLLKNQNLQFEQQLNMMTQSMAATQSLKAQISASCTDLCTKVVEFRAHKQLPIPEPPAPPPPKRSPSPSPTTQARRSLSAPRSSSPALRSPAGSSRRPTPSNSRPSASATSSSRLSSTAIKGSPSSSTSSAPGFTSRKTSPSLSSPSNRSSSRLSVPSASKPQPPRSESETTSQVTTPASPPPPSPPPPPAQVAVPLAWLDGIDEVAKGALQKLSTPAKEGGLKEGDSLVPYMPTSDNAFVAGAGVREGVLPSVDAAQVHNLELKLAELHPRLLKTSAILESVLLPSLPPETSRSLFKDITTLKTEVFCAARDLTHLSLLLPGYALPTESGPPPSTNHPSEPQELPPVTSPTQQTGSVPNNGQGEGPTLDVLAGWGVPILEDVSASLPAVGGEAGERDVREQMKELVLKFRQAASGWQREKLALNDEMDFYRGCHAAQAAYIKNVTTAGHGALEAVMGKGLQALEEAAVSVEQISKTLTTTGAEVSAEEQLQSIQASLPGLQRLLEVAPTTSPSAMGGRAAVLDPLEEEYQVQIKVVFNTLQSKRVAIYRQRSISGSL